MPVDEETKTTKGFAFIEFLTPEVCIATRAAPDKIEAG